MPGFGRAVVRRVLSWHELSPEEQGEYPDNKDSHFFRAYSQVWCLDDFVVTKDGEWDAVMQLTNTGGICIKMSKNMQYITKVRME